VTCTAEEGALRPEKLTVIHHICHSEKVHESESPPYGLSLLGVRRGMLWLWVAAISINWVPARATGCTSFHVGINCQGSDVADAGVAHDAAQCCLACQLRGNRSCAAWTWNKGSDHHCWLKHDCNGRQPDPSAVSGVAAPPALSPFEGPFVGVDCEQNDIAHDIASGSVAACAAAARATADVGCKAWTWDSTAPPAERCWLKSSCAGAVLDPVATSGLVVTAPPGPPLPPLPPVPAARTGLQRGVSLGGWLLMETSWMYDQFNAAAENDFIRNNRRRGDQFALDTMKNHWAGYIPDAALDAMAQLEVTHFRIPVGCECLVAVCLCHGRIMTVHGRARCRLDHGGAGGGRPLLSPARLPTRGVRDRRDCVPGAAPCAAEGARDARAH
jgi:hypothetical protein